MERLTFKNDIGHYALKTIFNAEIGIRMKSEVSKIFDAIDKLGELEDKLESGELVEVVRCKDCESATPISAKAYYGFYHDVMHCRQWRGDETKNCWSQKKRIYEDLSIVEEDDFCGYGEKR